MSPRHVISCAALISLVGCNVTSNHVGEVPIVICASSTSDVHCQSIPNASIGAGPSFASLGGAASLNSGFLDGHTLVVGASTGYDAHGVALGGLVSIDLATRERRVVLGSYQDASRGVVNIASTAQPAFTLGPIRDVQRARSDSRGARRWFAVGADGLLAIDPDVRTEQLLAGGYALACDGFDGPVTITFDALAVDDDDRALLVANVTDVIAFDPSDRTCRRVSSNAQTAGPAARAIRALRFARGALWALDDASVIRIDVTTGERTRVSSPSAYGGVGGGASVLGGARLDIGANGSVWTAGNGGLFVQVDSDSGTRTRLEPSGGPSVTFDVDGVWALDDVPLIVATAGGGVLVANVVTGTVNWLSR